MSGQITGNKNGTILEDQIGSLLCSKGYNHIDIFPDESLDFSWYMSQCRKYKTIYDTQMRIDYYVYHPVKWPLCLAIECKWQSSAGTVDEKIPYTILNMKSLPVPSVLFMAGGGYRKQCVDYAKTHENESFRVIEGLDSILIWSQKNL